jgi:hypothetical protein
VATIKTGIGTGASVSEQGGDWSTVIKGIHARRAASLAHGASLRKNGRLTIRKVRAGYCC